MNKWRCASESMAQWDALLSWAAIIVGFSAVVFLFLL